MPKALFKSNHGPVTEENLISSCQAVGIHRGDTIMIHSQLFSLGTLGDIPDREALCDRIIVALLDVIGTEGTLILPTFTFSFCRKKVYDPANTPSEMGVLTEIGRKLRGAIRTLHPIYSVAVLGRASFRFLDASTCSCFGEGSFFSFLRDEAKETGRVKFLSLGIDLPPTALTYVHHVEECVGVPYRYQKKFEGELVMDGQRLPTATNFYVRDMTRPVEFAGEACWQLWRNAGIVASAALGDSFVCMVKERDLFNVTMAAVQNKPDFLCRDGYCNRPDGSTQ